MPDPLTAADLLTLLESMLDRGVALHKLTLYVECDDSYYSGELREEPRVEEWANRSGARGKFLVFHN